MKKYYDSEFCKCGAEITKENRPQKYGVEEHVNEGVPTISSTITGCNKCLKMPLAENIREEAED